jgi:hypothetical protein
MAQLIITEDDIAGLAAALDGLELTDRQRALMTALMALAPKVASIEVDDEPVEPVETFASQFAVAYSPGKVDFTVNAKLGITRS